MPKSDDDLVHRVARAIAARRRALGLTQEALSERLELATKNVQRIEAGTQNLTLATLERVAAALETTPALLLGANPDRASGAPISSSAMKELVAAGFRVRPANKPGRRSERAVPLTTIRAAAGAFEAGARAVEAVAWVTLQRKGAAPVGQFIAQIQGHSMEPRVASGAICLFGPAGGPPFADRVFLISHARLADEGLEGPFALKQIETKKGRESARRLILRSINPSFPPIEVDGRADELRVVAELVEILVQPR